MKFLPRPRLKLKPTPEFKIKEIKFLNCDFCDKPAIGTNGRHVYSSVHAFGRIMYFDGPYKPKRGDYILCDTCAENEYPLCYMCHDIIGGDNKGWYENRYMEMVCVCNDCLDEFNDTWAFDA